MKYKMALFSVIIYSSLVLFSCSSFDEQIIITSKKGDHVDTIRPLQNNTETSKKLYDYIEPINYIQIKTKDAPIFTDGLKICYFKDNIYISDKKQSILCMIDLDGNYKKIGDIGLGAGEYTSIEDFNIDTYHNTILLLSNDKQSFIKYSLDGKYIGEKKLPIFVNQFTILDTNFVAIFINQNATKTTGPNDLIIIDKQGNIKQRLFNCANYPSEVFAYTGFLSPNSSSATSLFCMPFSDSIYEINNKEVYLKYVVSFYGKDFPIPKNKSETKQFDSAAKYSFLLKPALESKNYLSLVYVTNRRLYQYILNKNSHKNLSTASIANNLLFEIFGFPSGITEDDTFISVIDLPKLKTRIKQRPELLEEIKNFDKKLYTIIESASPYDNNIIAFYKLKII